MPIFKLSAYRPNGELYPLWLLQAEERPCWSWQSLLLR